MTEPRRDQSGREAPPRRDNSYETPQGWARGANEPQAWPRGSNGRSSRGSGTGGSASMRDAVSSRRDAQRSEAAERREPGRSPSRTAVARAERRRLDQPREQGRVHLPRFDPEAFGRWSEAIARNMGTAQFIVYMTVVIVIWFAWNTLAPPAVRFDPYTFTFLTLVLSLQASYAAPLILLAQNRQAERDRLSLDEDRRRAAMQKADTEYLAREIASLRIALGEVATRDFVRSELNRLVEDLGEAAERRSKQDRKEQRRLARRHSDSAIDAEAGDLPPASEPESELASEPASEPSPGPDLVPDGPRKERRAPQGARRATPTS